MNRREFVGSAVAGAALLARGAGVLGAGTKYDLLIKGGRVIDPSVAARRGPRRRRSPAGASPPSSRASPATRGGDDRRARQARRPGPDRHPHARRARQETARRCCLAGRRDRLDRCRLAGRGSHRGRDRRRQIGAADRAACSINIGRAGIIPEGDTMDLARADVGAARAAIAQNRDFVVGIKARLSRDVAGTNDYEVLRRAQEVAAPFGLPVMIHMGQTVSAAAEAAADLLKRGDIVTHMFAPPPNGIIDDSGRILPEVLARAPPRRLVRRRQRPSPGTSAGTSSSKS